MQWHLRMSMQTIACGVGISLISMLTLTICNSKVLSEIFTECFYLFGGESSVGPSINIKEKYYIRISHSVDIQLN